jgi:quercetin 2,3-dioxygenase
MKNNIIHKANSRGYADHGWLVNHHTFSFANYYNPERVHFGMLRVLNDDWIEGGMGFGTHPHDNMEIITIPLSGAIAHRDSMGNHSVIQEGEIQVMSAGSGITHSEFNANKNRPATLLQIWVFPNQREVTPRYGQIKLDPKDRKNKFQQIVSPNPEDEGVWIHQNAWFHLADLEKESALDYNLKQQGNGIYLFIIKGKVALDGEHLGERDGMGITEMDKITISAESNSEVLVMEVPMR